MGYYLKLYLMTLAAFFVVDMAWLVLVARAFYRKQLGFLLAPNPNWAAAVVFYLLFIAGLLVFVVVPGLRTNAVRTTALHGALFGLIAYATYDLTNLATIKDWPLAVTIVDLIWGTVVSLSVSLAGFAAGRWLGGVPD
jgi:uncharacterized membrane protein